MFCYNSPSGLRQVVYKDPRWSVKLPLAYLPKFISCPLHLPHFPLATLAFQSFNGSVLFPVSETLYVLSLYREYPVHAFMKLTLSVLSLNGTISERSSLPSSSEWALLYSIPCITLTCLFPSKQWSSFLCHFIYLFIFACLVTASSTRLLIP